MGNDPVNLMDETGGFTGDPVEKKHEQVTVVGIRPKEGAIRNDFFTTHDFWGVVGSTETRFYHRGGVKYEDGKVSLPGWYIGAEYRKFITPIASQYNKFMGSINRAFSMTYWTKEEAENVANTDLGRFLREDLPEETKIQLIYRAHEMYVEHKGHHGGRANMVNLDFELLTLGGGSLLKEGMEAIGKVVAKNIEKKALEALQKKALAKAAELAGKKASINSGKLALKPFTVNNYRHNLKALSGKSGAGMDAHHIFPQAARFQQHWNRVGLNIHDPKNLTWWQKGAHRQAARGYNGAWDGFFRQYPHANLQQINNFGSSLMKKFGF